MMRAFSLLQSADTQSVLRLENKHGPGSVLVDFIITIYNKLVVKIEVMDSRERLLY